MEDSAVIQKLLKKLEAFRNEHKEILGKISGLTCDKLLSDLQEAEEAAKWYIAKYY